MSEYLTIEIPESVDPVAVLIKDKARFLHSLKQFSDISSSDLQGERLINTIALAAGSVANQHLLYQFFIPYMPDDEARTLLEDLIANMGTLVDSTFGQTREDMESLSTQREEYCDVMDKIAKSYLALETHLREKRSSI